MAHRLISRAQGLEAKGTLNVKKETCEDFDIAWPRSSEESWHRLALRVMLVMEAARLQTIVLELTTLEPNRLKEEEVDDPEKKTVLWVSRTEVLSRLPLKPSKTLRQIIISPDECRDSWLIARGGRTFWCTCSKCLMRWPRTKGERIGDC